MRSTSQQILPRSDKWGDGAACILPVLTTATPITRQLWVRNQTALLRAIAGTNPTALRQIDTAAVRVAVPAAHGGDLTVANNSAFSSLTSSAPRGQGAAALGASTGQNKHSR